MLFRILRSPLKERSLCPPPELATALSNSEVAVRPRDFQVDHTKDTRAGWPSRSDTRLWSPEPSCRMSGYPGAAQVERPGREKDAEGPQLVPAHLIKSSRPRRQRQMKTSRWPQPLSDCRRPHVGPAQHSHSSIPDPHKM